VSQSRTMSLVESATNVVVGYVLAIATQLVVFPLFGIEAGLREHLTIGLAFVGVSLARGYAQRRLFEALARRAGSSSTR
jgi:F0F1-type ATP synthase membrane subunit c/vacuolar-type H+-ATPase subunit K